MLGIIGAMDEEVAKLKEKMEQVHIVEKAGMQFYRGSLCDREVVILNVVSVRFMRRCVHRQ